jgi:hypothetical protein
MKSFRPMMKFNTRQSDGTFFAGNGLRFATQAEAEAQAKELLTRWFVPIDYRVDPSEDAPNYRWDFKTQKSIMYKPFKE